jgi:hypothetical protein
MKNKLLLLLLSAIVLNLQANYTLSGPRTIFELAANKSGNHYTFFSFTTGQEVLDSNSTAWDIAFRGTSIILNGGTSGPSTVAGQILTSTTFETKGEAPTTGYAVDATGAPAIATGSGSWYTYYPGPGYSGPHTIIPNSDKLLAIRLADGRYVKVEMLNYYQGAPLDVPTTGAPYSGTGKYISFRYLVSESSSTDWSQLETVVSNLYANINNNVNYNFFSLASGDTLLASDSNSTKWDLAFKSTTILTNGGTSGPDRDSAKLVDADFDDVILTDASLLKEDGASKAITGWYTYVHPVITINTNKTIVVKTSNGRFAKIEMLSYYKDQNTSNAPRHYSFRYYFQPDGSFDLNSATIVTDVQDAFSESKKMFVVPNPVEAGNKVLISWPYSEAYQLTLYNASGTAVWNGEGTQAEVTLPELNAGTYLLRGFDSEHAYSTKVVIR